MGGRVCTNAPSGRKSKKPEERSQTEGERVAERKKEAKEEGRKEGRKERTSASASLLSSLSVFQQTKQADYRLHAPLLSNVCPAPSLLSSFSLSTPRPSGFLRPMHNRKNTAA
mmetsp:Transcript_26814/g.52638  ORF Transcript_26814/g.52638 Transcript_26814/m.52638 type:complete len:113 (+) Transcript_26814:544-882(+)